MSSLQVGRKELTEPQIEDGRIDGQNDGRERIGGLAASSRLESAHDPMNVRTLEFGLFSRIDTIRETQTFLTTFASSDFRAF